MRDCCQRAGVLARALGPPEGWGTGRGGGGPGPAFRCRAMPVDQPGCHVLTGDLRHLLRDGGHILLIPLFPTPGLNK